MQRWSVHFDDFNLSRRVCWFVGGILFSACASPQAHRIEFEINRPSVQPRGAQIVYVEAHDPSSGLRAGGYGDVVLLDSQTKTKTYVTRDNYLDDTPVISPNGRFLAFGSSRAERPSLARVTGLLSRQGLYVADLRSGIASRLALRNAKPYDVNFFTGLSWSFTSQELYYLSPDSAILVVPLDCESLYVQTEHPGARALEELSIAEGDSFFAVVYRSSSPDSFWVSRRGLSVYDVRRDLWTHVLAERERRISIGGWDPDGRLLMVLLWDSLGSHLMCYNRDSKQITPVELRLADFGLHDLEAPFFDSPRSIVFIATHTRIDEGGGARRRAVDVYRYELDDHSIEQLTNDGIEKSSLTVTIVR